MATEQASARLRQTEALAEKVVLEIRADDPADAGEGVPYVVVAGESAPELRVRVDGRTYTAALTEV